MSLPPDPDEPTRRVPEVPPREVPPRYLPPDDLPPRGAAVLPEDEDPRLLADRLRSLRTAVAVLSVLSLAALGVALWALLEEDNTGGPDRRGASTERVADLEDRVDALRDDVRDVPSEEDLSELRASQDELEQRVDEVSQSAQEDDAGQQPADTSDEEAREGVEQLSGELEELSQRIDEVQAAQDGQQEP